MDPATCIRCGYALTGLNDGVGCPECGLLAGLSRLDSAELRHNHPRWLLALTWGCWLTAIGLTLMPLVAFSAVWVIEWQLNERSLVAITAVRDESGSVVDWVAVPPRVTVGRLFQFALRSLLTLLPALILARGAWLLCRRSSRAATDASGRYVRWALRAAAAIVLLPPGLLIASQAPFSSTRFSIQPTASVIAIGSIVTLLILPILLFLRLRHLLRRTPALQLAADRPARGWALGGSLMLIPVIAAITFFDIRPAHHQDILPEEVTALIIIWTVIPLAAYPWLVFLLIRSALAFSHVRRQAQEIFAGGDLATSPRQAHAAPPP